MIVRSAIFLGRVRDDRVEAFDTAVRETVLPLIGLLPGVLAVELLRPREREEGAPEIYQIYNLRFADRAAMTRALDSPQRQAVHAAMAEILPWFEGRIVHTVSDRVEG